MKLKPQQLTQHLQNQALPLYWVSGDEPLLTLEAVASVRDHAARNGYCHREIFQWDRGFSWQNFENAINSLSLFSEKTLLELRLGKKKLTDEGKKVLHRFCDGPPADKLLLISSAKLEASTLKTKWFQKIEAAGGFIQVWPLGLAELPSWIRERCQRLNVHVDSLGVRLLAERGEGNLLALVQDLEKLSLLHAGERVTVEQVAAAISDNARFDVFTLVDAAIGGDASRALRIIHSLQREGSEGILILWALTREIRLLVSAHAAVKNGQSPQLALRGLGVWPRRMPLVLKALNRNTIGYWRGLLTFAAKLDATLKGVHPGNFWDGLERLTLGMAGIVLVKNFRSQKTQQSLS